MFSPKNKIRERSFRSHFILLLVGIVGASLCLLRPTQENRTCALALLDVCCRFCMYSMCFHSKKIQIRQEIPAFFQTRTFWCFWAHLFAFRLMTCLLGLFLLLPVRLGVVETMFIWFCLFAVCMGVCYVRARTDSSTSPPLSHNSHVPSLPSLT